MKLKISFKNIKHIIMVKNVFIVLILFAFVGCNTSVDKSDAFKGNEWIIGDEVIFRDMNSVSFVKFDADTKQMVGDTTFPFVLTDSTITYTLIVGKGAYNDNRQYVLTGDTTIISTVGYDFKSINGQIFLILYSENYPKICSSKVSNLNITETSNYEQAKFTIANSKFSIGDRINRDLLKTRGIYNYDSYTIEDCELKSNRDIKIKIIGYNQVYTIERHNIPNYRKDEIIDVVTSKIGVEPAYVPMRQLSEGSDYAYEFYAWSKNGVRIKLERSRYVGDYSYMNLLDSDTWNLYYDDDVQKALLIEEHKASKPQSTIIN